MHRTSSSFLFSFALHSINYYVKHSITVETGLKRLPLFARTCATGWLGTSEIGYVAPAIEKFNLAVTWSVAVDTYVAETLINEAETVTTPEWGEMLGDIDVIALASRGHNGGFQRWVMGSVTELDTKLPLLVVPPDWQSKAAENEQG